MGGRQKKGAGVLFPQAASQGLEYCGGLMFLLCLLPNFKTNRAGTPPGFPEIFL
ncbi:uncharacterized protein METZ01_LOCUS434290 [marine metagenome]|uniref:Uncharacterized protein n=1 Tax=marine metagenome TaxID=408172 RepID=A0A382YDR1_9ZZZZ